MSLSLTAKNFFRVSYRTGGQLQSHCFQASDAFNKQQWINCIRQAKEAAALTGDQPQETGQCLETGLGGQIGQLGEIGPSLCHESGLEDEKGLWGEMETGLCLEGAVGLTSEADDGLGKARVEDSGVGSEIVGEIGMDGKVMLMTTETESGVEMDTGGEVMSEPGARADWKLDQGGEIVSSGADDVPTSPHPSAPCQDEEESEVMEEEQSGTEKGVEVVMDTAEANSLQCEELSHRC